MVRLHLPETVVPAPRIKRPFENVENPYGHTGCSKLCHHPIDPEARAARRQAEQDEEEQPPKNVWASLIFN